MTRPASSPTVHRGVVSTAVAGVMSFTQQAACAAQAGPSADWGSWLAGGVRLAALGVAVAGWRRQRALSAQLQAARVQAHALSDRSAAFVPQIAVPSRPRSDIVSG